jgi:tetratricopeptide (TPR) repeat protein
MTDATIQEAERRLSAGDHTTAERMLSAAWRNFADAPAAALHVMGLIRRQQMRFAEAEQFLRSAITAEPKAARHWLALGETLTLAGFAAQAVAFLQEALRLEPGVPGATLALVRALLIAGRNEDAEQVLRGALGKAPSAALWELLARALRGQDRFEDALEAAEQATRLAPNDVAAAHSRAITLAAMGRNEEALAALDALAFRGVQAPAIAIARGTALFNLTRAADAEAAFAEGVRRWPQDAGMHNALANARWMRGDGEAFTRDFEKAVETQPENLGLRIGCADLLRRADFRDRAEDMLRGGLKRFPDNFSLLSSLGVLLDEMDRPEDGVELLQRAVALAPQITATRANLACALMRVSRSQEALDVITPARQAEPNNQEWICYETMALRQLGSPRYRELCDFDLMVFPQELPIPPGYANSAAFNEALADALSRLHVLQSHPLDQSLRHGSQTSRSLLHVDDPVIKAYLRALDEPIRAYLDRMGEPDPNHPWSGRKTGAYRLTGSWSVKLKAQGYHINHLHPAGWISSAYYVQVPEAAFSGQGQEGWIKFGEPRWPTPGCTIEKVVQPRPGILVLFPSYMWHGTIPFSSGERMTAPFDAVPV